MLSCALAVSFSADSVCFSLLGFSSDGTADGTAGWSLVFVFETVAVDYPWNFNESLGENKRYTLIMTSS